ncbi:peroxiredoxin [Candidatus Rickettsiella isopodorum]|jgi:peroxiredoxin Q/BCP|uniref:thioredoxin-dependent peroxiredoxin n=1 Tax=Candidatus Rickettsiella isopodorum TaxID=1225476 RepID=A0A1J8P5R1_9COXI|nr:peroxiredoxin [Candidatus Rickettsiella isopodorum]MCH9636900.1 peroxiredoxin [Gammaproteobacteria bacterium]MDQ5900038.1 thioredoxin-dependent peroxiredoxin [Pseudomonadota bacterium]MCH9754395.1 peroxiredoxin [Gammaproteobacteria bacterium]MDD5161565.1 peroxiredoxin [Candidatus Rickettsiella isopodorum]OIZ94307.1 peroxiredoxin [Candidatus Rickettsiella isopodorum]
MLVINKPAPDFSLPATSGKMIDLKSLLGKNVVLYFYPKDCTSGCTQEGKDFSENYKKFASLNTIILGVSRDSLKLHKKFKTEQQFPFELLSDVDEKVCHLYSVLKEKMMYGKKTRGIERSTFLIDKQGILCQEWRQVKVPGHVVAVLQAVAELS